ncbi:MAG: SRPBCC family protein [Bacteroidota bacterium]
MPFDQKRLHHFIYTIDIDAEPKKVWTVLTDVSRWHVWDTELKSAQLDDVFRLHATGKLIPKKGPELPFIITQLEEGKGYTFRTDMPIGHLLIQRTLSSKNGKTHFTDDIQFTGGLKYLFGLILGRSFQKVLPEVMHNFKQLAES